MNSCDAMTKYVNQVFCLYIILTKKLKMRRKEIPSDVQPTLVKVLSGKKKNRSVEL